MEYKGHQVHVSGSMMDVLTAATGKVNVIKLIQATNVTSSAATLDVAVSSSGLFYLAKSVSINTQASYVVTDEPVILEAGDKLQATCANIHEGLDLVVSYLQASASIA
jgi:ribosome-interacting GTPase 1